MTEQTDHTGQPDHEARMAEALKEAEAAYNKGEVPVGAIVVGPDGLVVGRGHNLRESQRDPLAHAEILAIRAAAVTLDRWRLFDCTLYVTLEPCPMCAGAIVNARLKTLVFGATDPRAGAAGTLFNLVADPRLNHRAEIIAGVQADASGALLRSFFAARRSNR